ncbi:MAG: nucleotidyltransferase domain-containing protein [Prevotella sp.]|nr:nucleotidyltransferase domain-containing protein [Prevotella sp.]
MMPIMVICFHKSASLGWRPKILALGNEKKNKFSFCISLVFSYLCRREKRNDYDEDSKEYIRILQSHADELQSRFGITAMRLFGSVARGEHHDGSDVDIFVAMPPKFYNHVAAAQYLEE